MVAPTAIVLVVSLLFLVVDAQRYLRDDSTDEDRAGPGFPQYSGFNQARRKLRLIQVVRRHGERTIYSAFPGDPYANYWVDGIGELTTKGVKKQYDYGTYLRAQYPDILQTDLKPFEIQVVSSDTGRSINSGLSNIAAIFLPQHRQVWNGPLGNVWRPVAIQTIPKSWDNLLYMDGKICPVAKQMRDNVKELPVARRIFARQRDFIDAIVQNTQKKMDNFWDNVYDVYDWLDVIHTEGLQTPKWVTPAFMKRLKYLNGLWFHMMYGDNSNVQKTRLEGGALANVIMNRMLDSFPSGNSSGHGKKFILYSAHDNTVAAQLSTLRSYNYSDAGSTPEEMFFGANLVYELYDDRTVRIRFQNNPDSAFAPAVSIIPPGCSEYCPLDTLRNIVRPFLTTRAQWLQECGAPPDCSQFKYPYDLPVDARPDQ